MSSSYNEDSRIMIASQFIRGLKPAAGSSAGHGMRFSGTYVLDKYDENLEIWLDSMNIDSSQVLRIVIVAVSD